MQKMVGGKGPQEAMLCGLTGNGLHPRVFHVETEAPAQPCANELGGHCGDITFTRGAISPAGRSK